MMSKAPKHPAEEAVEFWTREARRTADALDASRRETLELERHYRLALEEIKHLQMRLRAAQEDTR